MDIISEEINQKYNIVLASGSPRRKEILTQAGLDFTVIKSEGEEVITNSDPSMVTMELSRQKAIEVYDRINGTYEASSDIYAKEKPIIVIGSDTVVAIDGQILGKPKDEAEAVCMIQKLQGRSHSVFTGVTIVLQSGEVENMVTFACETKVYVYPMSNQEIENYVLTGEPMDKAGAYGIQGLLSKYVEKIEGDYLNVVGFPLSAFWRELQKILN